jgi:DNA invertase Pin-like site-specific DNA recombinase
MKPTAVRPVRCAIYTRVSTDAGLEQDFNSLDSQRDAAEAYIRSQAHAAWTLIRNQYNDGGYSGGSTDRPALQRLLADIRAKKVDVIVVYKVDRLTRSLADFAKLVELFDGHGVSFVSVTQQFNTTTSMGRLTLNVLLSFAQFEREVTSERIRDKIAASKRKGLWVGGMVPLGYEVKNRKVFVIREEAERVRTIFRRYLELGSLNLLMQDLRQRKILTKIRKLSTGRTVGGNLLTRGPLAHLLRNRFYIGEVAFKGEILPGEQPAILDRKQFEAVQRKLDEQRTNHTITRASSESLLMGRIFDDRGNRMTPSYASKKGKRYRYYLSSVLSQGRAEHAGSVRRVSASEIETLVIDAVRKRLKESAPTTDSDFINANIGRVEVHADRIAIKLARKGDRKSNRKTDNAVLYVPWKKTNIKRRREIIAPAASSQDIRPIRSETRLALVTSIACGRRWLDEIVTGVVADVEQIATHEKCSIRQVNMTISLAFLSPMLVKAAIDGRLPRGIGVARLRDAPAEWSRQHAMLGLAS